MHYDNEPIATIRSQAHAVLEEYGTQTDESATFADDRIKIHVEHGLTISLVSEVSPVVLETSGCSVAVYRPGRWESYLEDLAERAFKDREAREKRENEEMEERQRRAFSPIDDSALFPEYAEASDADTHTVQP